MNALQQLAKLLGVHVDNVDDAMRSERGYRAAISRRSLFAAGAALAAGSVLVGGPLPLRVFHDGHTWYAAHSWADYRDMLKEHLGIAPEFEDDRYDSLAEALDFSSEEVNLSRQISVCWDPVAREITDSNEHKLRASFEWWAKREGRGVLFGTEY